MNNVPNEVIGAIIAGLVGVFTAWVGHRFELRRQRLHNKDQIAAFLQSVRSELETLWEMYMINVGHRIEKIPKPPTEPFRWFYPVDQNYFTIYESNAHLIGEIKDEMLRKKIITVYNAAKGLVDQFHFHDERLKQLTEIEARLQYTVTPAIGNEHQAMLDLLTEDAGTLRRAHYAVKIMLLDRNEGALPLLSEYIEKTSA